MEFNSLEITLIKAAETDQAETVEEIVLNNYEEVEGKAVLKAIETATLNGHQHIATLLLRRRNEDAR